MKRLLLHTCCCPCFSSVFEQIGKDYNLDLYFCNPNIRPDEEYNRRLEELKNYPPLSASPVKGRGTSEAGGGVNIIEGGRGEFIALPDAPEGGEKCRKCIEFRLNETAKYASENNYVLFATTLTVSPHKNAEIINEIGAKLSKEYNIEYLPSNFKKNNGYLRSLELSKQYNLYRQNYCGCEPR